MPLKGQQSDAGVGKLDLLGITSSGRLVIIELKVENQSGGRSDPPPSALLEGLRYAAMIEADTQALAEEIKGRFGIQVLREPPIVQVLAPRSWWQRWLDLKAAGAWPSALHELRLSLEEKMQVALEFVALEDFELTYGAEGVSPKLNAVPRMYPVSLSGPPYFGEELQIAPSEEAARDNYLSELNKSLWSWADR